MRWNRFAGLVKDPANGKLVPHLLYNEKHNVAEPDSEELYGHYPAPGLSGVQGENTRGRTRKLLPAVWLGNSIPATTFLPHLR